MREVTKAIIPVAGWGTRMLPITKSIEKCMLPVGKRPVIDYVVQDVLQAGIKDIYFVVGEQSSQIQTRADGETKVVNDNPEAVPSEAARDKVRNQRESNDSRGRHLENCTEAFEAGVFNIRRSDPSYQSKLDRDNDGIACER